MMVSGIYKYNVLANTVYIIIDDAANQYLLLILFVVASE
jgi:hypothetical protein